MRSGARVCGYAVAACIAVFTVATGSRAADRNAPCRSAAHSGAGSSLPVVPGRLDRGEDSRPGTLCGAKAPIGPGGSVSVTAARDILRW